MPNKMGFRNKDVKNLFKNFDAIGENSLLYARKMMIEEAIDTLKVAVKMTPKDTGALRNSAFIEIEHNGKIIATSRSDKISPKWNKSHLKNNRSVYRVRIVYNMVYSAYQHSSSKIRRYSHPDARKYYLARNIKGSSNQFYTKVKVVKRYR